MSYLTDLNSPHAVIRERAEKVLDEVRRDYTVSFSGVLLNTIGRVATEEIADLAEHAGVEFDRKNTDIARFEEARAVLTAYAENRKHMTAEQRREEAAERRAAFGPGETVVNVITGERFRT